MKFGLVHRIMTDALAALGVLALVCSGQFSRWVSGVVLLGLGLALCVPEAWQQNERLKHVDTVSLLLVFAAQVGRALFDASVIDMLVEFAAALQIIRLATRKGAAHDQQVIVLALLHLIAGTVLGGGLGYGLCFLGVIVVAPGALVLSHLRREVEGNYRQGARDRTGLPVDVPRILRSRRVVGRPFLAVTCLLSIPIFLFTAALFVLFPRIGLSLLLMNRGHSPRMIGFSPRVDLGEVGLLRSDPALAIRVDMPGMPEPPPPRIALHLRGTALDNYDGRVWSQSQSYQTDVDTTAGPIPIERHPDPSVDRVMRLELEPIDPPVLFLPPNATGLRLRPRGQLGLDALDKLTRGPEGEFRYLPIDDRGIKYDILLSPRNAPAFFRLAASDRPRYLALPSDLPARIRDLATTWTQGTTTTLERARAIERHLRTEYRYDLNSPSGKDPQPLDHFLFESKRGHCEFYSTAMAVLLREVGVPTRNVTGFIGGTYNRFGRFYAVRQGDAHSWVEAYVNDVGWLTFDPTPPSDSAPKSDLGGFWAYVRDVLEATSQRWDAHVVGYDLNQQMGLFQALTRRRRGSLIGSHLAPSKGALSVVVVVVVLGAAGYVYLRRRRRKHGDPTNQADPRSPAALLATQLYEQLDNAMRVQGIARAPGTPPLRHAESLASTQHPLAPDVLELTDLYLRARFGGDAISFDDRRWFEQRVRAVRISPPKPLAASAEGAA